MSKLLLTMLCSGLAAFCSPAAFASDADVRPVFASLATQCAPTVHPKTLAAVVGHESGFDRFTIGVNGTSPRQVFHPVTAAAAIAKATELLATGASIDMGLGQIWSGNLKTLGLSLADVFDSCRNLQVSGKLLTDAYLAAIKTGLSPEKSLDAALSTYNTGNPRKGITSGYVAKVKGEADKPTVVVPELGGDVNDQVQPAATPKKRAEAWDLFGDISADGATDDDAVAGLGAPNKDLSARPVPQGADEDDHVGQSEMDISDSTNARLLQPKAVSKTPVRITAADSQ